MGMLVRRLRAPTSGLVVALVVVLGSAVPALADAGDPDTTFSGDGTTSTDFAGSFDSALDVAVQPNGRPVAVGQATDGETFVDSDFGIARYLTFGDPDREVQRRREAARRFRRHRRRRPGRRAPGQR